MRQQRYGASVNTGKGNYMEAVSQKTEKEMLEESLHSPALERIFISEKRGFYPARYRGRVPKKVVMAKKVRPDMVAYGAILGIKEDTVALKDNEYYAWVNSYGAVSAILPNGESLGLLPSEFDVTEWHDHMPEQIQR